jgi:phage-related protein
VKQIIWIGRSKTNLKTFPERVQRSVGFALWGVQRGEIPPSSKVLKGFGNAKVREIIENDSKGTFRVVYTVEFKEYVAVLHAFQKKSKSGIATPNQEIELVKKRLAEAKEFLKEIE